ncbi:MAG: glycosyltransferase family 39 protein [Anaerolineales bacterium]|nr:glycosyltransferase family 39 protein [Anaerolineales bacterium]
MADRGPRGRWLHAALLAIGLVAALRLALGMLMGLAWTIGRGSLDPQWLAGMYGHLRVPESPTGQFLLGVWPRWDAVQHLNLAMRGYFDMGEGSTVFYPLFAALTRGVSYLFGGNFILAGLAVATVATALAFVFLMALGQHLFGDQAGKWAAIALAVYPTAVFLIAPFTESLFLAFTLGAFLAAYRNRWIVAAVLAALASLTRGPGVAAAVSFAILGWLQWRERKTAQRSPSLLAVGIAVLAPIVGGAAFLAWRSYAGFPPMLAVLQEYVGTSVVDPATGLALALGQWIRVRDAPTTFDLLSAIAFLGVTGAMIARKRWRRPELLAYMLINLVVLLSRHTVGAASLKSLSRYVLVLFPAFLVVGDWLAAVQPRTRFWYLTASSCLLLLCSVLYVFWVFLG